MLQERRSQRQNALERCQALRVETRRVEQRDDLRRHQHDMRHAFPLDRGERLVGVELAMEDVGPAEIERRHQGDERAVEDDRTNMQCPRLGRHAEGRTHQRAVHRAHVVRVHDAFRQSGGAAREHDVEQVVGGDFGRNEGLGPRGRQSPIVTEAGGAPIDEQDVRGQLVADLLQYRQHRRLRDQAARVRALQQARQPSGHKQRRKRY